MYFSLVVWAVELLNTLMKQLGFIKLSLIKPFKYWAVNSELYLPFPHWTNRSAGSNVVYQQFLALGHRDQILLASPIVDKNLRGHETI